MPDEGVQALKASYDMSLRSGDAVLLPMGVAMTMTEDNLAREFARRFDGRLLHDHTSGRWLEWDGVRWRPDQTRRAYDYTREMVTGLNAAGVARWSKASVFAAVETIARNDRAFACTLDQFDADPWRIGTPGGILDLRTGALSRPDPAAMITKITVATPTEGVPVRWLEFLRYATRNDAEVIEFLRRFFGYCLTGLTYEQMLLFIIGRGGTGKSTVVNIAARLMGDYAQAADMRLLTASKADRHPTELAALRGARLVTANETERQSEFAEARVKQLTGGDVVRARFMRQDEFEFRPQCKLLLVGNHKPRLRDTGEAMRRRLRLLPFEARPEVPNPRLEDELMQEAGQILAWMVAGCLEWQRSGLTVPATIAAASAEFFESQDLFGSWLAEKCKTVPRASERSSTLFESWALYCRGAGEEPGTLVRFAEEMQRRGFSKKATMAGKVWLDVKLNSPQEVQA